MNRLSIPCLSTMVAAALLSVPLVAPAKYVTGNDLRELLPGATGEHWHVTHRRWYTYRWLPDGTLEIYASAEDEEPVETGVWRIKEVEPEEEEAAESVAARNGAIRAPFCKQLDNWRTHEICFHVHQVTFDREAGNPGHDADGPELPTQTYKVYREAGAETGRFTITRP
jgi:hypothetical protein